MREKSVMASVNLRNLRKSFEKSMKGGSNIQGTTPIWLQAVEAIVIVFVLSVTMQILESNFQILKKYQHMAVDIYPLTYNSTQVYRQDPSSCFPILEPSKDERNGSEYSYSCFIYVSPEVPNICKNPENPIFQHIFHKGSPSIYPLMAPGVFIRPDGNTLRIYHNSTKKWDNYIDVPNLPVNKWVHLVVMLKGNFLDIYVNGNLAQRMPFSDVPKLNYSDLYLLKGFATEETKSAANSILNSVPLNGYVSRLKYFAYALSFTQIDELLRMGPNKISYKKKGSELDQASFDIGLFQTDDWITSTNHSGLGPQ